MAKNAERWTLKDLVDFEGEIAAGARATLELRESVLAAAHGLDGAAARRAGLRTWLKGVHNSHCGAGFASALTMAGSGLAFLMLLAGICGVIGTVNHGIHGIHITLFLAILIGGQWLVLILAALAWLFRKRSTRTFSAMQSLLAGLIRRLAGNRSNPWWGRVMHEGGPARAVLLWRIARLAQSAGICFNIGIVCGLCGLLFAKDLKFFWESTTESAMAATLESLVHWLSFPWSLWWPEAVPDAHLIGRSRWQPGHTLPAIGPVWWCFALMVTLFWGLLPRLILWWVAWKFGRRALQNLDFQSRSHRILWRELTGPGRVETDEKPMDGVLVLDVGGSGIRPETLREFLLRHLRVNPTSWHSVAVMDVGAEAEASRALADAPAGVVLLAEGWALSPPRMKSLHSAVRKQAGQDIPVKFVIANTGPGNTPAPPAPEECLEWERWVDSLRDPLAEVFFYQCAEFGE